MKFQKELDGFAEKVKAFCDWVEGDFGDPLAELESAEKFLAELHLAILSFPDTSEISVQNFKDVTPDFDAEKITWKKCQTKFEILPIHGYWTIYDASKTEAEKPVFAVLAHDLADIHRDLKFGLVLYEKEMFGEAFWEWRFNFQIHWGDHLVDAQKTIRNYFSHSGER